jgi:hypothetical protein
MILAKMGHPILFEFMDAELKKRTTDKILQLRQHSEQLVAQLNANSGAISALETMLMEQEKAADKAEEAIKKAAADAKKNVAAEALEREAVHKRALAAAKKSGAAVPANAIPPGTPVHVFPKGAVQITKLPGKQTTKKK